MVAGYDRMSIFFQDPNEVRFPPLEVRLKEVHISPLLDGGRVKISIVVTPFQKRPNIDVVITNSAGKEVAHTSILEIMQNKLDITMHPPKLEPDSFYTVETIVYYQELPPPSEQQNEIQLPEPMIVDRQKTTLIQG
jgi:hypothetical protein